MQKMNYLKIFVIFSILINTACNSELPEIIYGNYYESNTLLRWNLKGKVKSLSIDNDEKIFEFNTAGYVSKILVNQNGSILIHEYIYDSNGKLEKIFRYFKDKPQFRNIESFTYDSTDRLVLKNPSMLVTNFSEFDTNQIINDLVLGLSSTTKPNAETKHYFVGDTLYICYNGTINNTLINDTTKVTYAGKYPVSYTLISPFTKTKAEYKDITFSNFGNIYHFTCEIEDSLSNISKRTYYYKPNMPSLLLDSIVCEYKSSRVVDRYTYNSHMDLIKNHVDDKVPSWENVYKYDSHGNWTKRIVKGRNDNTGRLEYSTTTTREIKYWK